MKTDTRPRLILAAILLLAGCNVEDPADMVKRGLRYSIVSLRITECTILQSGHEPASLSADDEYFSNPEEEREEMAERKLLKDKCKPVKP